MRQSRFSYLFSLSLSTSFGNPYLVGSAAFQL